MSVLLLLPLAAAAYDATGGGDCIEYDDDEPYELASCAEPLKGRRW